MTTLRSLLALACSLTIFGAARAQEFQAGVARADITPEAPIRLAGYASRSKPSESIDQHLFVKALALRDSAGAVTLLVTADTIGTPRAFNDELARRIEHALQVPRERFLFACSHSHSTPVVDGCLIDMYGLQGKEADDVRAYTQRFFEKAFEVAAAAIADLAPAKLALGRSEAFFAGNRRQFGPKGVGFGINPNGLVDSEVPVLRIERADGSLKAVVFGYACHCTTPGPSYEVSGDWAGYAQAQATKSPIVWPAGDIKWTDNPAIKGAKIAVLWGDPKTGGYGALKKMTSGSGLALHSHSSDQKVLCLSGALVLTFEGKPAQDLANGSYAYIPAGMKHTADCKAGADCTYFEEQSGASDIKFIEPLKK